MLMFGALGMAAPAVNAQQMTTSTTNGAIYYGGGIGLSIPVGSLGDAANTGWHLQGMGGWESSHTPWGFRGDLTYSSLGGKTINAGATTLKGDNLGLLAITGNVVWKKRQAQSSTSSTTPYIIAGLGLYHGSQTITVSDQTGSSSASGSFTNFGINAGAGLEFQLTGFSVYADARFHDIFRSGKSARYLPITVGVKIGGQ
jgi:opacity protein-like surface antigen